MSALKHGLLARAVVIDGPRGTERQSDFDALLADLILELRPTNFIEETLVERIATAYWRLRRVHRFEVGAVRDALEAPDPQAAELDALGQELRDAQGNLDAETRLTALLDKPEDQRTADESSELQQSIDEFAEINALNTPGLDAPDLIRRVRDVLPGIVDGFRGNVAALEAKLDTAQRDHAMAEARRVLAAALPDRDTLHKVVRYENMLDRQIHRALAELRRLRQVPSPDTTRKKRTRRTKPFDADT